MKNINKLALLLGLGVLVPLAASAETLEQSYLDTCRKSADIPVPVAVVAPIAHSWDVGKEVQLGFVVDTAGRASDIKVVSGPDNQFADAVMAAVKQWRFTPAQRNGAPVATRVILPVRVVDNTYVTALNLE